MLIGGAIQVILSFAFPRSYLAFPVVGILSWRILDALLIHWGVKNNVWAEGVIDGKWSVAYPSEGETEVVHGKPGENGPGESSIASNDWTGTRVYAVRKLMRIHRRCYDPQRTMQLPIRNVR